MAKSIPENFRDLLNKKALADVATIMPDGSPQVTPVWFDYDGQHIRINSAKGRQKDRNLRARPAVALAVVDPDNPYRYMQLRGKVIEITEKGADAHIDALSNSYLGKDYPNRKAGEVRVTYVIELASVSTMG